MTLKVKHSELLKRFNRRGEWQLSLVCIYNKSVSVINYKIQISFQKELCYSVLSVN